MSARLTIKGFTIVELLVVIVVLGVLVTISVVAYGGIQKNARDAGVLSDVDALDSIQTEYGLANGVAGKAWYSGSGIDPDLNFTPTPGNVIDVVINDGEYCIRAYHPNGIKNSITNAIERGSTEDACYVLSASVAAGGTGESPLIGWWKLNGNANNAVDGSGGGSIVGPVATTGADGTPNGAYRFDGVNDYIEVQPVLTSFTSFTVSAWARVIGGPSANSGHGYIVHQGPDQYQGNSVFWVAGEGTGFYGGDISGFSSTADRLTTVPANTTDWRMITMVYDGTNRSTYVDGNLEISTPRSFTNSTTSTRVGIGSSPFNSAYRPAEGDIDDVRIYNRALTASEVLTLFNEGAK